MDGSEPTPEEAEAFEEGRTLGRAEASCDCPHRADCDLAPRRSWWRDLLDSLAGRVDG